MPHRWIAKINGANEMTQKAAFQLFLRNPAGIRVNHAIVLNEINQAGVSTPTISTLDARAAGKAKVATG